jgi:hypothetical protein
MAHIIPVRFGGESLDFVTYTDLPQRAARDPMNREIVRSRAMRSGHAARNQEPRKPQRSDTGTDRIEDRIGRFRVSSNTKKKRKAAESKSKVKELQPEPELMAEPGLEPDPVKTVSLVAQNLSQLDPFVTTLGGHSWELLHHCEDKV